MSSCASDKIYIIYVYFQSRNLELEADKFQRKVWTHPNFQYKGIKPILNKARFWKDISFPFLHISGFATTNL